MTMTARERDFLRRYVQSVYTGAGYDRDKIPAIVAALAEIALKEDAIRLAQTPAKNAGEGAK